MLRSFLLPLLGLALLTTEAATAQTHPAAKAATKKVVRPAAKRRAVAAKKVVAKSVVAPVAVAAPTTWSGWSHEPLPKELDDPTSLYHPHTNVSSAPGMPLNQLGGGLTTDYDGRPLRRPAPASSSITMASQR